VTVTITDTSTGATRAQAATITQTIRVRPYVRPTIAIASPGREALSSDQPINLVATTQGDCGGALTTTWTASEGRITANGNQATFDPTSVAFAQAGATDQVKQITITANVRDTRNQTGATTTQLTVRRKATAVQLADILFTRGGTRVNNAVSAFSRTMSIRSSGPGIRSYSSGIPTPAIRKPRISIETVRTLSADSLQAAADRRETRSIFKT
jgi:hypothetical protein